MSLTRARGLVVGSLVVLAGVAAWVSVAEPPGRTSSFYGTVRVAGQEVPVGTPVSALVGGVELEASTTFSSPEGSAYRLDLPADDPATPEVEGGIDGAAVTFRLAGSPVATTATFAASTFQRFDLVADAGADLSLAKDDGVTGAAPGDLLTYTLTVRNLAGDDGGQNATVVLEDPLPIGTQFVAASDGGALEGDGVVRWPVFDLAVGATATRTLTLEVASSFPPGTTEIRNTATVRSDGADGVDANPADNTATDVDSLAGGPDLVVAKSADLAAVEPGGDILYTLTLTNEGFQDATEVVLVDTLPDTVFFLTASDDGRAVDGVVTWPPIDLAVGATVERTVRVRLRGDVGPEVAEVLNTASASSTVPDVDPSDDSVVHTLPVVRETDLALRAIDPSTATVDPQTLMLSGVVTVTVENAGNADALAAFDTVVFEDLDGDDLYTPGTDNLLGTLATSDVLVGETVLIAVPVAGTVLFRDNPVHAFVDAGDVIPELDETNNLDRSGQGCAAVPVPGDFDPVVEIEWPVAGTDVRFSADSLSTPIVVHLTDDNGDGVRGEGDTPDIVFVSIDLTFPLNPQPRLRAIAGDTGARIFDAFPPVSQFLFFALTGMAAGDIDLDGAPEILVSVFDYRGPTGRPNRLAAYSHTGQLQWISQAYVTHPDGDSLTNRDNPTIADLDGDGVPEIVVGANVFNNGGGLLWSGTGGQGYQSARNDDGFDSGAISIVANLDLAGDAEVVTGNTAYRSDGSIYWQVPFDDGYTAVANFDGDDFPEIVVVARGTVRLHQHDGGLIWATEHPGAGPEAGGAPTVADFDGDGEPEIGVAGSTQYAVFEGDGSVRWQTATQDGSSNMTGSTVFDLDGDGQFEVIYRDETALRIYRGDDGVVLYELPMSSITLNEQPVVADVDGDGNAEIVVTSDVATGVTVPARTRGLRVIGDDDWVAARGVWNQHAYHIGNVADDGSIPASETPSWLDHNTYRANIAPVEGAFAAPDITAARLVVDLVGYPTVRVTARIGNGGAGPVSAGLPVAFYDGDPAAGATLLATTTVAQRLEPGAFTDVRVEFLSTQLGEASVFVVADDDGTGQGVRSECDETNNLHGTVYDTDFLGLVLDADDGVDAVRPGDSTTYRLQVTNADSSGRTGIELRAELPTGTSLVSASDGGGQVGTEVVWPTFQLIAQETIERTVTLQVEPTIPLAIDTVELRASVADDGALGPDPSPENNVAIDLDQVLTVIADAGGPYSGDEGVELVLDASASIDRDGTLADFLWDLDGDGVFDDASGATVPWTFPDDGVFSVAVQVVDDGGEVDVATTTATIGNQPPSFELGADLALIEGTAAVFESLPFTDPGTADTHTATVDWGDGTNEAVALLETGGAGTLDAAHAYLDNGEFTVEVCLSDDDGATVCDQVAVSVANAPPDVVDGGGNPLVIDEGDLAEIALPFKDLGPEDTHTTLIDWGDGTVAPGFADLGVGSGVVVFEETFEDENGGRGRLNYSTFERWTVRDGTVDLIGNGFFDFHPGQGLFLDLDGSTGNAGILATRAPIVLTPGRYQLRFALSGSRRGGSDTVIVRLGGTGQSFVDETIILTSGAPLEVYSFPFNVTGSSSALLEFEHLGGDNRGLLLDDILIADECLLAERDGGFQGTDGGSSEVPAACGLAGGSHVYPDDGFFDAEICVTDDDGGVDCGTVPIEVRNVLPLVEAGDDRVAVSTEPLVLDAVFLDPGILDPHEATIDWGDGTVDTVAITPDPTGGSLSGSHSYATEGDYEVEVCVTDDDGVGCDRLLVFWREPRLDLAVELAADTVEVRPGQTVGLTVDVANEGSLDPGTVTVTLALPLAHDFVAASDGGVFADDRVTWTIPDLAFAESRTFTVELTGQDPLPMGTEAPTTVTVVGDVAAVDSDPSDDQATVVLVLWDDETPYIDPIDEEPLRGVEGDTVQLEALFSTEPEQRFLDDDFNGERNGRGTLNYFDWANWSATEGSVDLIGNGFFDFYPGNGLYVDLDGSTGNAARFASREFFELRPGTYTLGFHLGGSRRGDTNTVDITVADVFAESITLSSGAPYQRFTRNFTVETTTVGEVVFDHRGGNNLGLILDNVLFVRDCVATATLDWGDGTVETFDTGVGCSDDATVSGDHVYLEDGVYPVELCVTDAQGDSHCVTTEAIIDNAPPVVTASDGTVEARRPFVLDPGTFTDLGVLDLHTATIDWGDGTVAMAGVDEVPGSGTIVRTHGYAAPGTYAAQLCVVDDEGAEGCAPFTVTATGASQSPDLSAQKIDSLGFDEDGDGTPTPGDFLVYDIVVSNLGGVAATEVVLRDVLEPGLALVPGGVVFDRGTLVSESPLEIDLGTLEPGVSTTVHFYVEILPGPASRTTVENQATVSSAERPLLLSDDPATPVVGDPTVTVLGEVPDDETGDTTTCETILFDDFGWRLANLGDADQGAFLVDGANGEYLQLTGDGTSLFHSGDNGAFYYREVAATADFRLEVDITGLPVDEGGQVRRTSLMVRTGLDPFDPRVMVTYAPHLPPPNPGDPDIPSLLFDARLEAGDGGVEIGNTEFNLPLPSRDAPVRLAIEKRGDVFTVLYSLDDGATWTIPRDATFHGMAEIAVGETILAGMMVASYDPSVTFTAEHGDFTVCRPNGDPPFDPEDPPVCDPAKAIDAIVLLDVSGSMTASIPGAASKLEAAQTAIAQLASELASAPGSRMALVATMGYRTPAENLAGAYDLRAPLTTDLSSVASLAAAIDPETIDPGTPTPSALSLRGLIDDLIPTLDPANQPVVVWFSDGIANIDILGRGPEPYELEELQAIDLRDGSGAFLSWGQVGWSGAFNGETGTFDGEPLANAMFQLERLDAHAPDLLVYGLALEGDGVDLGTFNPGLLEYAAHVSGGRSFAASDLTGLLSSVAAVATDLDCGGFGSAVLAGRVWNDTDGDGSENPDTVVEPGLAGVTVNLFDGGGAGLTSAVTDGNGAYVFDGLPAGTYSVQVDASTLPTGGGGQPIDVATFDLDGIATVDTATLTVADGELRSDVSFGYQEQPPSELCTFDGFDGPGLDPAWQLVEIGDADQGSVAVVDGELHLTTDGTSLFHGTDNGTFLYQPLGGDFRSTLRVVRVPDDVGGPVRKVCLMAREGTGSSDARVMVCHIPHLPGASTQALQFDVRREDGTAEEIAGLVINAVLPIRIALVREGGTYRVEYSIDNGLSWIQPTGLLGGELGLDLGATPLLGVMGASYDANVTTTFAVDEFEVCAPNPAAP